MSVRHWREKYQEIETLSRRNGVFVKTVKHRQKHYTLIKRTIPFDTKAKLAEAISLLTTLKSLKSDRLVKIYSLDRDEIDQGSANFQGWDLDVYMEYMDKGSFDKIYERIGPIPIDIVGEVALAVSEAMSYTYGEHGIVPRCIKPSNILLSARGSIKLCDYGMSTEVMNSQPESWVRTSYYASPERVQGHELDQIKGDVWALGITVVELALGRFPYGRIQHPEADWMPEKDQDGRKTPTGRVLVDTDEDDDADWQILHVSADHLSYTSPSNDESFAKAQESAPIQHTEDQPSVASGEKDPRVEPGEKDASGPSWVKQGVSLTGEVANTMSVIELLTAIVSKDAPRLPEKHFPLELEQYVDGCLKKDPGGRMAPKELLDHSWTQAVRDRAFDVKAWTSTI